MGAKEPLPSGVRLYYVVKVLLYDIDNFTLLSAYKT
jgi:hypothetical protein